MGGKQKQAQRTKGNVKPSSSGRSAALLNTAGFSGLKDSLFPSFQSTTVSEEIDASLDPNFQLVLKKMNKKDSTTRVKALQEFIKLVESSDPEVLKGVLPFWPRLYCLLVGDGEHRVREVANDAQRSVMVNAKRNMAPYLRSLAGPWFIAQFDTYPPAATAAVRAFQEAFPPNKLIEVIAYCHEEILKYISDNLLDEAIGKQDISERTEKQERIIITSLQGFCHYVKIVQDNLLSKPYFLQISETLLQSQHFWKCAMDKAPLVRSAWLSVITTVLEKVPHLLKEHHQLLVKRILGRLDETDAIVIPYVWQAALSVLVRINDWSKYCDMNKQVFPRLWNILREGGYGCASTIFPNMLPLLNSLLEVKETQSDKEMVVDSFYKSLREGFEKKTVQHSKSESEAVAQCYIECMRFVIKCGVSDSKLVLNHLIPVIELMLTESKFSLLSRGIYEHISRLLHYWSSEKCISQYETICNVFWDALLNMFKNVLIETSNDSAKKYILSQEVLFCSSMKNPDKLKNKSILKVRFSTEEESSVSEVPYKNTEVDPLCDNKTHNKYLKNFIMSLSSFYLQKINDHQELSCVIPLAKLLSEFNDHELIEHLVSNCNVSELFSTLSKKCFANSGQYVEIVVELACSMIQHLKPIEREDILNTMCQEPDILVYIFRAAQKEKIKLYILQWLRTPPVQNHLIKLTRELCAANASSIKAVLMECIARTSDGDFLVDVCTISSIISEISKTFISAEIAMFASQFLSNLHSSFSMMDNHSPFSEAEELSESTYRLIVLLFCFCCDKETICNSIKDIVSNGWQSGVNVLSKIAPSRVSLLISELSGVVRSKLLCSDGLLFEDVENLVEISLRLLSSVRIDALKMCSLLLNGVLAELELLEHKLIVHSGNILTLLGAPACNLKTDHQSLTSEEIFQYILLSLFTSMFITKITPLEPVITEENEGPSHTALQEDFEDINSDLYDSQEDLKVKAESPCVSDYQPAIQDEECEEILLSECITHRVLQLALAVSTCEIYSTFFQNMAFYNKIHLFIKALQDNFSNIKSTLLKREDITHIRETTLEKANQHGGLWVPAVYLLSKEVEWISIHKSLSNGSHGEYSAKILFKKAFETSVEFSIKRITDSPSIVELTFYIKYSIVPDESISSMIVDYISPWIVMDHRDLLYDCDISTKSSVEVENTVKKIYFLSTCIQKCPFLLEQHIWDFIIISAAYYAQNLKHIQKFFYYSEDHESVLHAQNLDNERLHKICTFSVAVFELITNITEFCRCVTKKELFEEYNFEDRAIEWKNVFANEVHSILTNIFISLSGHSDKLKPSFLGYLFLQKVCSVMIKVNEDVIVHDETSRNLEGTILTACCKLLHSPVSSLQISAYYIFKTFLNYLVERDSSNLISNQDPEDSVSDQLKFEIYPLLRALQDTQAVVDTMLADFSFGDSCIIEPHTDSYYYTAAYLLLWNLLLQACNIAGSELRYQYATLLRNEGYLASLLNNLFILMPSDVLETVLPKTKSTALASMFSDAPLLSMYKESTSLHLQHWACWIYCNAVSRLPALVRQWWGDTKSKVSSIVQKATVQYVTPLLCMKDLQAVQNQKTKWKNMEVKVHSKARQVVAIYTVDEAQMELIITLPEEYPLATIQVDSHTSSLVGTSQWRNWVKQLSIFLTHQNGSLWDGLLLWKSNLDKRFEGVEECYICFSILHGTNFQIPKLCCKTCKKKFHSPCLYKWFSTSNKSTCPICRNMF